MRDDNFNAIADALERDWHAIARPEQLPPPGDWFVWLILSGRGWGKTRTGAEWILDQVRRGVRHLALVGATTADVRMVMLNGPAGLLTISHGLDRPEFEPTNRCLIWPNGAVAYLYSAEEPNRLRGPQFEAVWCDELAAWADPDEAWEQLGYGLRIGSPKVVITTTPRPIKLIKKLISTKNVIVTRGSTFDNQRNLSQVYFDNVIAPNVGTRKGRQEIDGEILQDAEGALWSAAMIEAARITLEQKTAMTRIVVAVDPAVSMGESSDETGIVVAGLGENGHGYVLADASGKYAPTDWAREAVRLYHRFGADRVVAEVNQGGDMVESTLRMVDPNVSYKGVHASRGKIARAEPVSALYEQSKIHHVGTFPTLEDQLTSYEPGGRKSPDRLDALVWALTELMVGASTIGMIGYLREETAKMVAAGEVPDPVTGLISPARGPMVRLLAPVGSSTVMTMSGESLTPDSNGVITCPEADARALRALGWPEAPATSEGAMP